MKKNPLAPKSENTFKYGINGKIKEKMAGTTVEPENYAIGINGFNNY